MNNFKHIGNIDILNDHKTALFCSRKASPDAILKTLDLAVEWRERGKTIISGFHSPVEKEVLHILLKGKQPIIICPARCVKNMRIPRELKQGIEENRILIISTFEDHEKRITAELCTRRNQFVAELANIIYITDNSTGGNIDELKNKHKEKIIII